MESPEDLRTALRELQSELIACQRLALLGSMAAMVAHEFNNLLTPIMAPAEAAMSGNDVPFMRKTLARALTQSQRAMRITRLLLNLAHDEARPQSDCALAPIIREALDTLTRPLEKDGITLQLDVSEDLRVRAQPDLLCQLLLNLLLNARRAMEGASGILAITARPDGGGVQIEIRDAGKGIAPDLLDGVINPFLAADPNARPQDWQRVGLGLSVCRLIAHHHGATLEGARNADRGCTFRLRWPAGLAAQANC
jgi:signal transduction histidine kinase